jgi:hypothetical protein
VNSHGADMKTAVDVGGATGPAWLSGLRAYLVGAGLAHLTWESLQLPLYALWDQGTPRAQAFAVAHCTLGDLLIALSALVVALVLVGDEAWPRRRFWRVAGAALVLGVAYTVFSEWLNVAVRASWAYSERMPVIRLPGFDIGVSPLLQWIVVPAIAFAAARRGAGRRT